MPPMVGTKIPSITLYHDTLSKPLTSMISVMPFHLSFALVRNSINSVVLMLFVSKQTSLFHGLGFHEFQAGWRFVPLHGQLRNAIRGSPSRPREQCLAEYRQH